MNKETNSQQPEIKDLNNVFINVSLVRDAGRQSDEYGNDLKHEIAELVEHGVLHLLGVHHEHDE